MNDNNFSIEELNIAINTQKNNKAPGPDGCRAELVKWLSDKSRNTMLALYKDMIETGHCRDIYKS